MAKKIKIELKNIENLEFEIKEDSVKGDYFSLRDLINQNDSNIISATDQLQIKIAEQIKEKIKKEQESKIKLLVDVEKAKIMSDFEQKVQNKAEAIFKERKLNLEKEFELNNKNEIHKKDLDITNLKNKNKELNDKLESSKVELKQKYDVDLELFKTRFENQFKEQLVKKESELQTNKVLFTELKNQLEEKKSEIDRLSGELDGIKATMRLSTKVQGNIFEDDISEILKNGFNFSDNVSWGKTTKEIQGSMPDFFINFLDNNKNIIESIIIEAKSIQSKTGSTKNSDHYAKLEKDRKNNNARFAILVTELEPQREIFIENPSGFENIFVVRINVLWNLINLLKFVILKEHQAKIGVNNYFEKERLIDEFNQEWSVKIAKKLKDFNSNLEGIKSALEKQRKLTENMEENLRKIMDSHLRLLIQNLEQMDTWNSSINIRKDLLTTLPKALEIEEK
ncbi:DUF2130 domain-containing protein [Mycoplasma leonicaptivi]|uniref:DUF2130 domain-containing protein n=1 Tax=Mycoplasma leonicaptivi TaxID=36742 RepID=UPI0004825BCF|nr:DUF2130 domain-containing protein [Mycoplasma leonicaptivi]